MDKLRESALAFQRLMNFEYRLWAGSKGRMVELTLVFNPDNFMHLLGLHKLRDIQKLKRIHKGKVLEGVLNGLLTYKDISKSEFFDEVEERLQLFFTLEKALDNNELVIKYKKGLTKGTTIDASYIIIYEFKNTCLHYFVKCDDNTKRYYGCSFFARADNKYRLGQQTFKVLKKIKYHIATRQEEILVNKIKIEENEIS